MPGGKIDEHNTYFEHRNNNEHCHRNPHGLAAANIEAQARRADAQGKTDKRNPASPEAVGSVPSCRSLRQLLDELPSEIIQRIVVWLLEMPVPTACLEVCAIRVNPESDVPVADAAGYVGL